MEPVIRQIALALSLDRQFSFDNFVSGRAELILSNLQSLILGNGEIQIGLWGAASTGKTHLLNAGADFARANGVLMQIYDATQLLHCDADEFEGFSHCDVLAIDNLDALAGDPGWEACFYQVINRCRDGEYRFLYSMTDRPENLPTRLDDFRSRLQWGLLLQLPAIGDGDIRQILRKRARLLGIELSDEVISYLMTRHARDLAEQIAILRHLDGISLRQQRRVTIPLVKQALRELG
ncbi:MAG: DnaA regulatory inactivator Hda [Gammaproteobacteria bacterium]|nr:DnaA regulatory inactivator Hda [Gammaproteobacteria bacterium]